MKRKINNNPDPNKKRKCLADIVFLDMKLLYTLLYNDNLQDKGFKPTKSSRISSVKYHLVDSKAMSDFINHLINDYRLN